MSAASCIPSLGFVTGWSMTMDYMLNPLICTIWCGKAMADLIPEVPLPIWFVAFAVLFTVMNLRGVETSARINQALCAAMGLVILVFFVATARYLLHLPPQGAQFFTLPFYNPKTFSPGIVFHGTSLAVLTYIGFDGISTLSEEVHNPKRNILLATVLVCVVTGVLASAEVYGAQLLRPEWFFPESEVETAFIHVAAIAGGIFLSKAISLTLIIATIGSGMGAQLGAARLLYGMGRSNAIPKGFFGAIDPRTRIPRNNVILVGGDRAAGSVPDELRARRRVAELRRADRLHGRQPGVADALLHSRQQPHAGTPVATDCGLRDLRRHLVEPVARRQDRRLDLDAGRRCVRSVEDARLPGGPGELRRAGGIGIQSKICADYPDKAEFCEAAPGGTPVQERRRFRIDLTSELGDFVYSKRTHFVMAYDPRRALTRLSKCTQYAPAHTAGEQNAK